jgi:hypothetical protein
MEISDKALANGWGWVLGVEGDDLRCYSRSASSRAKSAEEALAEIAEILGVSLPARTGATQRADAERIVEQVRLLHDSRRRAIRSALLAWETIHGLARERSFSGDGRS